MNFSRLIRHVLSPSSRLSFWTVSNMQQNNFTKIHDMTTSSFQVTRNMNRNARRPKKANHGKRPCSHARRRERWNTFKSVRFRTKIFGFW